MGIEWAKGCGGGLDVEKEMSGEKESERHTQKLWGNGTMACRRNGASKEQKSGGEWGAGGKEGRCGGMPQQRSCVLHAAGTPNSKSCPAVSHR